MRANAVILLIGLLLLVGTAGAVIQVSVTGNQSWLVAGSGSSAAYTTTITNITSGSPIAGATITFSVDPVYGTMSPSTVTTNSAGQAFSIFTVKTKSGTALINATIGSLNLTQTIPQNIDHNTPYYDPSFSPILLTYPVQGVVATKVPFNISMYDYWKNPIDNRTGNHYIDLSVGSSLTPDDCSFDGGVKAITLPLDTNGKLSVNVTLTSKIGINHVLMNGIGDIPFKTVDIEAVAGNMPVRMTGTISNGGVLPVATQPFIIDYSLYDVYDNPMANRSIWISTNLTGETTPQLYTSDNNGLIRFYYGPKVSILTANITAISADNSSVKNSLTAQFISSGVSSNLLLVITPQTMASRDTNPITTQNATVLGILTDSWGNPVSGENVTFTISNPSGYNSTITGEPSFDKFITKQNIVVQSDSNGIAKVMFYPGYMITDTNDPGYSDTLTGTCQVLAQSPNLTSNMVTVEWKNFAYLSAAVNVTPQTVVKNETIDVTISITGDGYKMVANPITVVLDMDTTSNMNAQAAGDKTNVGGNGLPRFDNSKIAAKTFVADMSPQDQIGLVTYGYYPNNQYWELISNASYNHVYVNNSIDSLVNQGGLNVSIRDSVHEAVTRITTNPTRPTNEVAAIITIGDSSYQSGDFAPMVQESWTNNNIRIYSILYVSSYNNCNGNYATDMSALTNATHGKFYCEESLSGVIDAFDDIRQNLTTIAGVNTSMELKFENVQINSSMFSGTMNGTEVFDYIFIGPESPPQPIINPSGRTSIIWTDGNQSVVNQTDDWNDDSNLNFTIGTIHIKETWKTTFRFKVKQEGIIDLFGPGSTISYNGGTGNLKLPLTQIISINNTIPIGLQTGTLSVTNLIPDSGNFTDSVPMQWNLTYTGFDTVTETYWYSYNNLPFVEFGSMGNIQNGTYVRSRTLDITKFPPGTYQIKVIANVPGIPSSEDSGAFIKLTRDEMTNIRLK